MPSKPNSEHLTDQQYYEILANLGEIENEQRKIIADLQEQQANIKAIREQIFSLKG